MTISNLKVEDDGSVAFSGTVELSGEVVVFQARVLAPALEALVGLARWSRQPAVALGPVEVRVTGVGTGPGQSTG